MSTQWPDERESDVQQQFGNRLIDTKDNLSRLLEACPSGLPPTFVEAVEWISRQGDDTSELARRMDHTSNVLKLMEFPESVNLLMTWACAEALAKTSSLQTWQNVRKLISHSWQLEHWLSDAMIVYVEHKPSAKDAYVKLAKDVFKALDNFQLASQSDRHNEERRQLRRAWNENREKLDEIWWGLRGGSIDYEEGLPLFQVLEALDFDEFLAVLSQSTNPYLVHLAFWAIGVSTKFGLWERLAASAPLAFAADGTWNTSVSMPLLLVIARDQLLQAGSHILRDASDADAEKVKQEIANLTETIVGILAKRQDALPLFARWSTWLMRQLLMEGLKDANNVCSPAFVDAALIEAIGRQLQGKAVNPEPPSDAPTWEAWCYRAVLSSYANSGFIALPDCKNFLDEWMLNLDDWIGDRGKQLRERASLIVVMIKEMPSDAVRLLAYPIAMSDSPVDIWIGLWNDTQSLREIVEFGNSETSDSNEYQERDEAGKLLLLVFSMGLAVLDQRASQCLASSSHQARDLAKLHGALAFAVREMREIDILNREQWLQAVRNLAVRRLIWESRDIDIEKDGKFPVFLPEDKPNFSDYLKAESNDAMELIDFLRMTILNGLDPDIVRNKLLGASIDLSVVIAIAKRLNIINSRKYPFDETQLRPLI